MKLRRHSEPFLKQLPSQVADIIAGAERVLPFIAAPPTLEALLHSAAIKNMNQGRRELLVRVLAEQNATSAFAEVQKSLTDLGKSETVTVTTGHQLNVLGGPAYFIYKIAHTVALARALEQRQPGLRVVPMFWMASEDHDFAEIAAVSNFRETLDLNQAGGGAVGPMCAAGLTDLAKGFVESCHGLDSKWADFLHSLGEHRTLSDATRALVDRLFGKYGVVVIDANDARLKAEFAPIMAQELVNGVASKAISSTNAALVAAGYPLQLNAREINLFYLGEASRDGIMKVSGRYMAGNALDTDEAGILELLQAHPERFSPNAALRPVYQEFILPNLAYVGGPGEMSYWLQLKGAFDAFKVDYPILIPRNSVTVIGSKESEWMDDLGLTELDLLEPLSDLTRRLVLGDGTEDPVISASRTVLNRTFAELAAYMKSVDATLEAKAAATAARLSNELDGLEKAIVKAKKQKDETRVRRLERIYNQAFPSGPQERKINFFALSVLADEDLIDRIITDFRPEHGEWLVYLNQ